MKNIFYILYKIEFQQSIKNKEILLIHHNPKIIIDYIKDFTKYFIKNNFYYLKIEKENTKPNYVLENNEFKYNIYKFLFENRTGTISYETDEYNNIYFDYYGNQIFYEPEESKLFPFREEAIKMKETLHNYIVKIQDAKYKYIKKYNRNYNIGLKNYNLEEFNDLSENVINIMLKEDFIIKYNDTIPLNWTHKGICYYTNIGLTEESLRANVFDILDEEDEEEDEDFINLMNERIESYKELEQKDYNDYYLTDFYHLELKKDNKKLIIKVRGDLTFYKMIQDNFNYYEKIKSLLKESQNVNILLDKIKENIDKNFKLIKLS